MKASEWGASLETGLTDNFSSITNITHSTGGGGVKSLHILVVTSKKKEQRRKRQAMECRDCIYII